MSFIFFSLYISNTIMLTLHHVFRTSISLVIITTFNLLSCTNIKSLGLIVANEEIQLLKG